MTARVDRPEPRRAPDELLVLQRAEELAAWLLERSCRWPKRLRFVLTQRIENHALDLVEMLVQARYEPRRRRATLTEANLRLERVRFLLRIARAGGTSTPRVHEGLVRRVDEIGRMLHGWRVSAGDRQPRAGEPR